MMKFPLIYRYIDPVTGKESDPIPHYECVTYKMGATQSGITIVPPKTETVVTPPQPTPVVAATTPTPVPKQLDAAPTPTPKQITSTKTGPELYFLAVIIALITPALIIFRRRRA